MGSSLEAEFYRRYGRDSTTGAPTPAPEDDLEAKFESYSAPTELNSGGAVAGILDATAKLGKNVAGIAEQAVDDPSVILDWTKEGISTGAEGVGFAVTHPFQTAKMLLWDGLVKPLVYNPIALQVGDYTEEERFKMGKETGSAALGWGLGLGAGKLISATGRAASASRVLRSFGNVKKAEDIVEGLSKIVTPDDAIKLAGEAAELGKLRLGRNLAAWSVGGFTEEAVSGLAGAENPHEAFVNAFNEGMLGAVLGLGAGGVSTALGGSKRQAFKNLSESLYDKAAGDIIPMLTSKQKPLVAADLLEGVPFVNAIARHMREGQGVEMLGLEAKYIDFDKLGPNTQIRENADGTFDVLISGEGVVQKQVAYPTQINPPELEGAQVTPVVGNPYEVETIKLDFSVPEVPLPAGHTKGSNAGGIYKTANGEQYYAKFLGNTRRALVENLSNTLYRMVGLAAPESKFILDPTDFDDKILAVANKMVPNATPIKKVALTPEIAKQVLDGFVMDVLLANHDVLGTGGTNFDNVVVDEDGKVWRIDNGGALDFRALGEQKEAKFLDQLLQWDGFANSNINKQYAAMFAAMGYRGPQDMLPQIGEQLAKILKLRQEHGGFDALLKALYPNLDNIDFYSDLLDKRLDLIAERYNLEAGMSQTTASSNVSVDFKISDLEAKVDELQKKLFELKLGTPEPKYKEEIETQLVDAIEELNEAKEQAWELDNNYDNLVEQENHLAQEYNVAADYYSSVTNDPSATTTEIHQALEERTHAYDAWQAVKDEVANFFRSKNKFLTKPALGSVQHFKVLHEGKSEAELITALGLVEQFSDAAYSGIYNENLKDNPSDIVITNFHEQLAIYHKEKIVLENYLKEIKETAKQDPFSTESFLDAYKNASLDKLKQAKQYVEDAMTTVLGGSVEYNHLENELIALNQLIAKAEGEIDNTITLLDGVDKGDPNTKGTIAYWLEYFKGYDSGALSGKLTETADFLKELEKEIDNTPSSDTESLEELVRSSTRLTNKYQALKELLAKKTPSAGGVKYTTSGLPLPADLKLDEVFDINQVDGSIFRNFLLTSAATEVPSEVWQKLENLKGSVLEVSKEAGIIISQQDMNKAVEIAEDTFKMYFTWTKQKSHPDLKYIVYGGFGNNVVFISSEGKLAWWADSNDIVYGKYDANGNEITPPPPSLPPDAYATFETVPGFTVPDIPLAKEIDTKKIYVLMSDSDADLVQAKNVLLQWTKDNGLGEPSDILHFTGTIKDLFKEFDETYKDPTDPSGLSLFMKKLNNFEVFIEKTGDDVKATHQDGTVLEYKVLDNVVIPSGSKMPSPVSAPKSKTLKINVTKTGKASGELDVTLNKAPAKLQRRIFKALNDVGLEQKEHARALRAWNEGETVADKLNAMAYWLSPTALDVALIESKYTLPAGFTIKFNRQTLGFIGPNKLEFWKKHGLLPSEIVAYNGQEYEVIGEKDGQIELKFIAGDDRVVVDRRNITRFRQLRLVDREILPPVHGLGPNTIRTAYPTFVNWIKGLDAQKQNGQPLDLSNPPLVPFVRNQSTYHRIEFSPIRQGIWASIPNSSGDSHAYRGGSTGARGQPTTSEGGPHGFWGLLRLQKPLVILNGRSGDTGRSVVATLKPDILHDDAKARDTLKQLIGESEMQKAGLYYASGYQFWDRLGRELAAQAGYREILNIGSPYDVHGSSELAILYPEAEMETHELADIDQKDLTVDEAKKILDEYEIDIIKNLDEEELVLYRANKVRLDEQRIKQAAKVASTLVRHGLVVRPFEGNLGIFDKDGKLVQIAEDFEDAVNIMERIGRAENINLIPAPPFKTPVTMLSDNDGWDAKGNIKKSLLANLRNWANLSLGKLVPTKDLFITLEDTYGKRFFNSFWLPLQKARMQYNVAIQPWVDKIRALTPVAALSAERKTHIYNAIQTFSAEELLGDKPSIMARPLTDEEKSIGKVLAERTDYNARRKAYEYFKAQRELEKALENASDAEKVEIQAKFDKAWERFTAEELVAIDMMRKMRTAGAARASIFATFTLADAIEFKTMNRADYMKHHNFTALERHGVQEVEKLFKELGPEMGIEDYRMLGGYVTRMQKYDGAVSDGSLILNERNITAKAREFIYALNRTGETVDVITDPIEILQRYLTYGMKVKHLFPAVKDATDFLSEAYKGMDGAAAHGVHELASRYLNEIRGFRHPADVLALEGEYKVQEDAFIRMMAKVKIDKSVSQKFVNTYLRVSELATQGFKPVAGIRDATSTMMYYAARFGFKRTAKMMSMWNKAMEVKQGLREEGVLPGLNVNLLNLIDGQLTKDGLMTKFAELGFRYSGQPAVFLQSHAMVYLEQLSTGYENVTNYVSGKINREQLIKKIDLDTFDNVIQEEFWKLLGEQPAKAVEYLADIAGRDMVGHYGMANHPLFMQSKLGKVLGQHGQWPLWMLQNFGRMFAQGNKRRVAGTAVRLALMMAAMDEAGEEAGFNLKSWLLSPLNTLFTGGPLAQTGLWGALAAGSNYPPTQEFAQFMLERQIQLDRPQYYLPIPAQAYFVLEAWQRSANGDPAHIVFGRLLGVPVDYEQYPRP